MKNCINTLLLFILTFLSIIFLNSATMFADKNGKTGASITGCTCHDQGNATSISIQNVSGNTIYMKPSENRSFTAVVAHSSLPKAGVNISVKNSSGTNVGTINSGTGTKKANSEITHNGPQAINGGQVNFGFSWIAPTTTGNYILRVAACAVDDDNTVNGDAANTMTEMTVTVTNPKVTVTVPNGGELICKNSQMLISWTSIFVTGNVKIELSSNGTTWTTIGTVPASSNFYQYSVPAAQTSAVTYKVRVSDATNSTVNDVSDANFSILSVPVIVTHPKHDSTCVGGSVTYTVTTDNQPGYTYQWRKNTNPIAGATGTSYTITNAQQSNEGDYDVVVTGCSPVTSNYGIFQINTPPSIIGLQNDTNVCKGSPVTLSCIATGTNLTYQWKKNGTVITGGTSANLSIPSVNPADTGSYTVVVSGKCPSPQTSNIIKLGFSTPPVVSKQPRDTLACLEQTIEFFADAIGNNLTYQWRKDGKNIENAVGKNFSLTHITASDAGVYDVIIKNSCDLATTSSSAILKIRDPILITTQPTDTTIQAGLPLQLFAGATGTSIKYQWLKNGIIRTADTLPTLTISSIKVTDSGNYKCVVKSPCGSSETAVAKVKVTAPPSGAALSLSIGTLDFGCSKIGTSKDSILTNVVLSSGGQSLIVANTSIIGADAGDFSIINGGGNFTLTPNEKRTIAIRFKPTSKVQKTAAVEFISNTSIASPKLNLLGKGCSGSITAIKANFGATSVGTKFDTTVKICNSGDYNLLISNLTIEGACAVSFSGNFKGIPLLLKPSDCIYIPITFLPTSTGKCTADLVIKTDEGDFVIPMEGVGNEVIGVQEFSDFNASVTVYPNPSSGDVIFNGTSQSPMPIKLRIFDGIGNSVYQTMITVPSAGEFTVAWDGKHNGLQTPIGKYTALFSFGAQTVRVPFLIVR